MSNAVRGNYIGTDVSGTAAIPNEKAGVEIDNATSYNVIGGSEHGDGNLISGNGENGVALYGSGAWHNTVCGNYIGTDISGTSDVGDGQSGVWIAMGSETS